MRQPKALENVHRFADPTWLSNPHERLIWNALAAVGSARPAYGDGYDGWHSPATRIPQRRRSR